MTLSLWPSNANAAPTLTRGPYLQDLSGRQAALLFDSSEPFEPTLEVWKGATTNTGSPLLTVKGPRETTHELTATGLEAATSYHYKLSGDGVATEGTFTTAPDDDRPSSFLVYGDNRSNHAVHRQIAKILRSTPADFLVHTGDMVDDGSRPGDWVIFFDIERDLLRERCVFPVIGNHEIAVPGSDGATRYAKLFRVPAPIEAAERWYSFRWGNIRFFMLDAQDDFDGTERDWLEKALIESTKETGVSWRFVVMHHGPYSSGLHGGNEAARAARVPEMLRKHKVDVLFSGHDHAYERGDAEGLRYVVSGGGGAPLYRENRGERETLKFEATHHFAKVELAGEKGVLTVTRADGSLLERCGFARGGAGGWDCTIAPPSPSRPLPGTPSAPSGATMATMAPSAAPSSPNPGKKSCGCSVSDGQTRWVGFGLSAGLVMAAGLRRRARDDDSEAEESEKTENQSSSADVLGRDGE